MISRFTAAFLACTAFAMPALGQADITREGAGERRAELDKMELTPFDDGLWDSLQDWRGGDPISADAASGKVVLVYTFAGYLPTAVRPMTIVNRIAESYADQGLLVVGVHADEAYEDGVRTAERRRASFPIARDAGNAFRDALMVDQDPDFYLIDRAGRLRFADVETSSLERAVAQLVEESADDAETLLDRRADARERAAEDARRSARLRSQIDLRELPWVSFTPPSPEDYENADWPKFEVAEQSNSRRRGNTQPAGPIKLALPATLDWRPEVPANTEGRATAIYLFESDILDDFNQGGTTPATFFDSANRLQAQHSRDLLVVGAMVRESTGNSRSRRGSNNNDDAKAIENANKVFEIVTNDMPVNHARVNDYQTGTIANLISARNSSGSSSRNSRSGSGFVIPYMILVDSSGTVRWHGSIRRSNSMRADWEAALQKVLKNDPGIQARKAAEEAYLKSLTE